MRLLVGNDDRLIKIFSNKLLSLIYTTAYIINQKNGRY